MKFHHIGIFTNHPKRILNFYQKKLGFKKEYQARLPKDVIRPIFGIAQDFFMAKLTFRDSMCLEVFWPSGQNQRLKNRLLDIGTVGYNHFGLEVGNKQEFCARLTRRYKLKLIKIKRNGRYTYFIQDPDRNLIEIMEPK